jgi:hypothetical protein
MNSKPIQVRTSFPRAMQRKLMWMVAVPIIWRRQAAGRIRTLHNSESSRPLNRPPQSENDVQGKEDAGGAEKGKIFENGLRDFGSNPLGLRILCASFHKSLNCLWCRLLYQQN